MYSNNILNFQESTTILNACTKKSVNLSYAPRMCMSGCIYMFLRMYVCMYVCLHIYIYLCLCVSVCVCTCVCVRVCVCLCMYVYSSICIYIYLHMCVYLYIFVYIYIYIYIAYNYFLLENHFIESIKWILFFFQCFSIVTTGIDLM